MPRRGGGGSFPLSITKEGGGRFLEGGSAGAGGEGIEGGEERWGSSKLSGKGLLGEPGEKREKVFSAPEKPGGKIPFIKWRNSIVRPKKRQLCAGRGKSLILGGRKEGARTCQLGQIAPRRQGEKRKKRRAGPSKYKKKNPNDRTGKKKSH